MSNYNEKMFNDSKEEKKRSEKQSSAIGD